MTHVEKSNKLLSALVVSFDVVIINLLFVLFSFIWKNHQPPIFIGSVFPILLSFTVSYIISIYFTGVALYYRMVRPDQIFRKTFKSMVVFLLIWILFTNIINIGIGLNRAIVLFFSITTILILLFRLLCHSFLKSRRKRGRNSCDIIYIGSSSSIRELYEEMTQQLTMGYNIIGYFDETPNLKFGDKCSYLGHSGEVVDYLANNRVDRVYCGLKSKDRDIIMPIINYCEGNLIRFFSVPNFRNYCQRRVSLDMFSNVPLLTIRIEPLSLPINKFSKRFFDVIFSLSFLCTAFLPIYLLVGIITKITSPGPIFFKQKRHGLDGKEFYMYKFRSMKVNNDADTLQATVDDPRKTKFGNFLRKSSIDELPQFINVLKGDMSVVGPRPHMVKHTEEYSKLIKTYMVRHYIKPGVTGWAQVTGFRGETKELSDMEGRVKADIWYIEHWTFTLDLYIIYKTVANIVRRKDKNAF
ncbi:MAG: undecaprenyl-phosphate glucose phosphotransferase [Rikenellaceae bacterium]